jgi:hypothetical protein
VFILRYNLLVVVEVVHQAKLLIVKITVVEVELVGQLLVTFKQVHIHTLRELLVEVEV